MTGSASASRYEEERDRQIAKNRLRLQQLGVSTAADALRAEVQPVVPQLAVLLPSLPRPPMPSTTPRAPHLLAGTAPSRAARTQGGCDRTSASAAPVPASG